MAAFGVDYETWMWSETLGKVFPEVFPDVSTLFLSKQTSGFVELARRLFFLEMLVFIWGLTVLLEGTYCKH